MKKGCQKRETSNREPGQIIGTKRSFEFLALNRYLSGDCRHTYHCWKKKLWNTVLNKGEQWCLLSMLLYFKETNLATIVYFWCTFRIFKTLRQCFYTQSDEDSVSWDFIFADFQVVASTVYRQRWWPDAAVGGAWRPASRSFQTHLPALLQSAETFSAGLQKESGLKSVCSFQWH